MNPVPEQSQAKPGRLCEGIQTPPFKQIDELHSVVVGSVCPLIVVVGSVCPLIVVVCSVCPLIVVVCSVSPLIVVLGSVCPLTVGHTVVNDKYAMVARNKDIEDIM